MSQKDLFCPPGQTPAEPLALAPSGDRETSADDVDLRDQVYRALLKNLVLSPDDKRDLETNRSLSSAYIDQSGYRSLGMLEICKWPPALHEQFEDDLYCVPGFVRGKQGLPWLHNNKMLVGVVIPIRSPSGKIVGLKTRRRGAVVPKYCAFSSPEAPCGDLIHFPLKVEGLDEAVVGVCEGEFAADYLTSSTKVWTVSSGGAGIPCWWEALWRSVRT